MQRTVTAVQCKRLANGCLCLQEAAQVVATATTNTDSTDNDPFTGRNSTVEAKR